MYMMCLFFSVFPSRSVPRLICLFKNHILVIFGGKNVFIYEIKMSEMSGFFFLESCIGTIMHIEY